MAKQSLLSSVYNHILDQVFGPKYYFVLMHYPNQRVIPENEGEKALPLYETSSNIFFTYTQAKEYLEAHRQQYPSDYLVTDEVISFRTRKNIPHWNRILNEQSSKSRII